MSRALYKKNNTMVDYIEEKLAPLNLPDPTSDLNAAEEKEVYAALEHLLGSLRMDYPPEEEREMRLAFTLAFRAHAGQRRKSGEPYILHPIEVARICADELGLAPRSIKAALMHDVVEDTEVTLAQIRLLFGQKVSSIVDGLTKFSGIANANNVQGDKMSSPQAENFKKILLTIAKDVRVVLIKMADRLHNMRTLGSMPHHKQLKIASETSYIYAPLAHRLGFYSIKTEMEDLVMKIIEPTEYQDIVKKLQETKDEREAYIEDFIAPVRKAVEAAGYKARIFGRAKSISSINNKLKKKQLAFEEIYDFFAIRIVLDLPIEREKAACWNVYSIITDYYTPVPERLKDWVSMPKTNGYESLHTTVMGPKGRFVEVQIRSERMDEIAEMGFAAHWKYKGVKSSQSSTFERWLTKAREMLENPETNAIEFLNSFKSNLFSEEVYVFTPKGDLRFFPKGATALDFAFDIHSEVGYHCKAVKVAEKIVPLSYRLRNGDQLRVVTSPNQKPTEGWLKMVETGRARHKIRQALREERMKLGALGKETLERKLKTLKLDADENIDVLVKYYGLENRPALYYGIYQGQYNLNEIKLLRQEQGKLFPELADTPKEEIAQMEKPKGPRLRPLASRKQFKKPKLMVDGEDASNYTYSLATCCNPVMGDDIFAYVTSKHGLKIHRTTCPNAEHMQATYGYRIKKAEWVESSETSFVADLLITGMDDMGVVQQLSNIITNKLGVNMRSFSMEGLEGHFEGRISLMVQNKDQLKQIIMSIKNLDAVNTVARIE